MITLEKYYIKSSDATLLRLGLNKIWFSYDTIVAFEKSNGCRYVSQNIWTNTTGKHLNAIDDGDKKSRLSTEDFQRELNAFKEELNL
jgi:hypothetical protein